MTSALAVTGCYQGLQSIDADGGSTSGSTVGSGPTGDGVADETGDVDVDTDGDDDDDTGADTGEDIDCPAPLLPCDEQCCHPDELVELPIEVLGREGTTETRTLTLGAGVVDGADRLWLRVNNLGYQDKGSVQINDGEWISLNHDTVEVEERALARGGMVHGGLSTMRIALPATDLQDGDNELRFRFDLGNAISIGYRIVDLGIEDGAGIELLPPWATYEVDPATWSAPIPGEGAIEAGRALWYGAQLWSHDLPDERTGFWYGKVIAPRQLVRATCTDCHTQDGRDLELFSYSNRSIIERAKFHGLSEEQGEQIASYIRSLSDSIEDVGRYGRPWNPPFQPGPAVADMPVEQWPAGAGLDAVLDRDADMAAHMFGDPVTESSVHERLDPDAMVDRTTLPLAIQFPDWKHWLPLVHPMDAYNDGGWYDGLVADYDPYCSGGSNGCVVHPDSGYQHLRAYLEAEPPEDRDVDELLREFEVYWFANRAFFAMGTQWRHWRSKDSAANLIGLGPDASFADMEFAATSLARLMAVKQFELHHEFQLADKPQLMLGERGDQVPPRQWFGDNYQVFEIPPHFTACFDPDPPSGKDCNYFTGQLLETGKFESSSWYHLQSIVNGGNGQISHNSPVDYNYQQDHTMAVSNISGIHEPLRMVHQLNTMYQTRTWSGGDSPNTGRGFRIRVMGPWVFYAVSQKGHLQGWELGDVPAQLDDVEPGLQKWVLDAFLEGFLGEMADPQNALETWDRVAPHGTDNALDPADKTMADLILIDEPDFVHIGGRWADKTYSLVPLYAAAGVECSILDGYVDWGEAAWPLLEWDAMRAEFRVTAALHETSDGVRAIVGSPGDAPVVQWTVNGLPVDDDGLTLDPAMYTAGDTVEFSVQSNDSCLPEGARQATVELLVDSERGSE
ncbi:MAG: hypothetical protein AAF799_33260 [Myxococcota bacterium]